MVSCAKCSCISRDSVDKKKSSGLTFHRDGSDVSSSGSEKNFQKGPRTSSRNDRPQFQKKFDKPKTASFNNTSEVNDSWNVSPVTSTINAAPATATFQPYNVVGTESNVIISWFHNPGYFYCQLADVQEQFKTLMAEIQQFYKGRKSETAVVGAPIIGLFPEDNVLYRAQVIEISGNQYKVYYVDFGNVSNITKVWPIERKFMELPAQAIACSLNEIAPPGEQWPDPDNYSKYFDKDKYICKFVNKDEEKTYVDFFYGNDDIKQLLVQEGLAISTKQIIPDIEIPLLLGQQFKAIIKSINNLSDIIVALECGVAISCTMHNLEGAESTDENNLKRFLERTVIIYVDNVIDDKLEITLYDNEGSKIEVLSPDEGACDMVELPCPILILRSTLTGYVSHADDTFVFIQPTEYAETITYTLDQMFESYESLAQDVTIIPEVELLYAVKSQDGNWYRAKVTNMSDTEASVFYIDYGNTEDVEFNKLRQLSDKFLETSILCIQVFLAIPSDVLIDKEVVANVYYGENGWEGSVEVQGPLESSSTESAAADKNAIKHVVEVEEPSEVIQQFTENQNEAPFTETPNDVELSANSVVQNGIRVVVSHVDTPNEFYLQLADSLNAIDELQQNLQEQALEMPTLENPTAGVLCAAPFSLDQQWYRAEVLDADSDITTVRFIDYGNTDVINNETTKIKTLPPNLLSLAVYATRSSLKVKSIDGEWSTTAIELFEALIGENSITAEFIDQDEKTNYVELYSNGQNIKDIFINENFGAPMESSEESKSTCFVSHLNSPSEFWLQLENCIDELEWIAEQLSGAENFSELNDTTPGTLCAALFPDDQMWYRARILSNTVAGLELLFIDYGNSSVSSSLRQLPEDLVVTPPLAQKCSLQKPDGIPYWTPEAVNKFSEISAEGQTIFTVRKISTGETSVVQLLIEGEDVTSMLLPETEEGYIKNIESLDNFTIEKNGEILPDHYSLEPLAGTIWAEESANTFKELNKQGTKLFQIEFIAENNVRLYVDGNDIRNNLESVKISVLNVSKTSTDEENKDNEENVNTSSNDNLSENGLKSQTPGVPTENDVNENDNLGKEPGELESIVNLPVKELHLQGSSDDLKHILGITTKYENGMLQNDIEDKHFESSTSDMTPEGDTESNKQHTSNLETELLEVTEDKTLSDEKISTSDNTPSGCYSESHKQNTTNLEIKEDKTLSDEKSSTSHMASGDDESHKQNTNNLETEPLEIKEDKVLSDEKSSLSDTAHGGDSESYKQNTINLKTKPLETKEDKALSDEKSSTSDTAPGDDSESHKQNTINLETKSLEIKEDRILSDEINYEHHESNEVTYSDIEANNSESCSIQGEPLESKDSVLLTNEKSFDVECLPRSQIIKADQKPDETEENDSELESSENSKNILDIDIKARKPESCIVEGAPLDSKESIFINEKNVNAGGLPESQIIKADLALDKAEQSKSELESSEDSKNLAEQAVSEGTVLCSNITPEKTKQDTCQELGISSEKTLSIEKNLSSENLTESEVAAILEDTLDNMFPGEDNETRSRPVSSCSAKIAHDDRIVPAAVSRPQTPLEDMDDKLEQVKSRSHSACSGKLSHDERIVPAVLSRPQSPIPQSNDTDQESKDEK